MVNHQKPTPEELDAAILKAQSDLDNIPEEEKKEDVESGEVEKENMANSNKTKEEDGDDDADKEKQTVNNQEEKKEENKEENKEKEEPDYKKKFSESTRESLILQSKVKKMSEAIKSVNNIPEPTDAEMTTEYPDWDVMTDTEKKLAKDSIKSKKAISLLGSITKESEDIEAWGQKVDAFIDDPKTLIDNPELEGKVEDLRIFASKPTRMGTNMEDMVKAFLYDVNKSRKTNRGKMFEQGSGGPNDKMKKTDDKISLLDARILMKNDYKKYKEMLLAGKIATE